MKWSMFVLAGIGLIAAFAAALLVTAWRAPGWSSARRVLPAVAEDTWVVAAHPIGRETVIDAAGVTTHKIARGQGPREGFADPSLVIGRTAATPIQEGQAVTAALLAPEGSGPALASQLAPGQRAVAIAVTDYAGLEGLLYPGSRVDVIASFRMLNGDPPAPPVAVTLLQCVPVLAVEHQTVAAPEEKTGPAPADKSTRARRVTLEVDSHQAKALELAQEMGTLSLALRNPQDRAPMDAQPVTLLAAAGLPAAYAASAHGAAAQILPVHAPAALSAPAAPAATAPAAVVQQTPEWETTIIRGSTVETKRFALPAGLRVAREE